MRYRCHGYKVFYHPVTPEGEMIIKTAPGCITHHINGAMQ